MNTVKYKFILITTVVFLSSCFDDDWRCVTSGKTMYSINSSGKLGGAQKGCSCQQIRSFEMGTFGSVDSAALKSDFGC
jgi:hypothetical protein